ncbi:Vesicle tethering protein [[Candida] zeylanoides]
MDYLNTLLSQNQAQSVEEAIPTLCNRLQHATHLADRRAAVLGLKSFSRQYRETVVEHGLRALLSELQRDHDQPVIAKGILETLLILFLRGSTEEDDLTRGWISQQSRLQNGRYPSPVLLKENNIALDQFSFWIADEVMQHDGLIGVLVEALAGGGDAEASASADNFHVRLYTLQLFESVVAARPARFKECLLHTPTSVSTLARLLEDTREPIRNEAILLLMAVCNTNYNIQKLVAFENAFDTLFSIIAEEGGVRGSVIVQDCLTLVTNLLQYNASNQKYFLETSQVPRLARLLAEPTELGDDPPIVWTRQRVQNVVIALEICRTFASDDNELVHQNQAKLGQAGILLTVLKLAFSPHTASDVRGVALLTAGDIIKGNPDWQLAFAQIDVPYLDPTMGGPEAPVAVPLAVLNWALLINTVHVFDLRVAAAYCLRCYLQHNHDAQREFLRDQIAAYRDPNYYGGEVSNIIATLVDYNADVRLNPYRAWFAAVVLSYVIADHAENRATLLQLTVGDASVGEEVMTSIQAIANVLLTMLDYADPRIAIGYLMVLTIWCLDDFDAVNGVLADASVVRSVLSFLSNNSTESSVLVHGMATIWLGVLYEFSSRSSPLARADLHSLLVKSLGRDNYSLKVKRFVESAEFKQFGELDAREKDDTGLPQVYFEATYVDLVKSNYPRIKRALFHDPLAEPQGKLSFEMYEELEQRFAAASKELAELQASASARQRELQDELETAEANRAKLEGLVDKTGAQLDDLRSQNSALTTQVEHKATELRQLQEAHQALERTCQKVQSELAKVGKQHAAADDQVKQLQDRLEKSESARTKAEEGINKMSRELFQLSKQKKEADQALKDLKSHHDKIESNRSKDHTALVQKLTGEIEQLRARLSEAAANLESQKGLLKESEEKRVDAEGNSEHLMDKLRSAATAHQTLSKANRQLEAEIAQLKSNAGSLEQQVSGLQAQGAQAGARVAELEKAVETVSAERHQARSELQQTQSSLEEAKQQRRELEDSVAQLQSELEGSRQALATLQKSHDDAVSGNKESVSELENALSTLRASHKQVSADEVKLKNDYHELLTKQQEVSKEKHALAALLEQAEHKRATTEEAGAQELTKAKEKYAKVLEDFAKVADEHTDLKEDHASLKGTLDDVTTRAATLAKTSEALECEKKELLKKHETLAEDQRRAAETLAKVEGAYKDLQGVHAKLESDQKKLMTEHADLTGKHAKLQETHTTLEGKVATLEALSAELKAKKAELESHKLEKSQLTSKIEKAQSELKESQEQSRLELEEYDKKNAALLERITTAEASMKTASEEHQAVEAKLSARVKELVKEADTKTKRHEAALFGLKQKHQKEATALKERIDGLTADISKLETKLTEKTEEVERERAMLNESSDSVTKEYSEKIKKLETDANDARRDYHAKLAALQRQKEELQEAHDKALEESRAALEEAATQRTSVKSELKELSSAKDDWASSKAKLEKKVIQAEADAANVKQKLASTASKLEVVGGQLATAQEASQDLESKLQRITSELDAARAVTAKEDAESTKLTGELAAREQSLKTLQSELAAKSKELAEIKETLEGEVKSCKTESAKLADTRSSLKTLQQEKASLTKEIAALKAQKEDTEKEAKQKIDTLTVELNAALEAKKKLEQHVKELSDASAKQATLISTLETELEGLKESKQGLIAEVARLRSDEERKTKELASSNSRVQSLEAELEQAPKAEDIAKMKARANEQSLRLEESQAKETKWSQTTQEHTAKVDDLKSQITSLSGQVGSLTESNNRLAAEKEHALSQIGKLEAKLSKTVMKSELDDLMLLMAEMEEKKSMYKEQLKSLGKEVSSDEDDEDDDDDDHEDE